MALATTTPLASALRAMAARHMGSISQPMARSAPAFMAAMAQRPEPEAKSSTALPRTSSG